MKIPSLHRSPAPPPEHAEARQRDAAQRRSALRATLNALPQMTLERALAVLAPPDPGQAGAVRPRPSSRGPSHLIVLLGVPADDDGWAGPSLQARIDRGAEAAAQDRHAVLVVTGAGVANMFAEAEVMRRGLIAAGVDARRIVLEPRARTTVDNAAQVAQLLDLGARPLGFRPSRVTLVVEPYHAVRSLRLFSALWFADAHPPELRLAVARSASPRTSGSLQPFLRRPYPELERCIEEKRKMMLSW